MPADAAYDHTASILVHAPARAAHDFMASGEKQSNWALGSWDRTRVGDDLWVGRSLFDGSDHYVRLSGHPDLGLVDYWVGASPEAMTHKIQARVIDAAPLGHPADSAIITLTVWRGPKDVPEIWARTFHTWQVEMHLIKHLVESEFAGRGAAAAAVNGEPV